MKLHELLDKALPYKVTEKSKTYFQAEFEVNGRTIMFDADLQYQFEPDGEANGKAWEIAFIQRDPKTGIGRWDATKGGKEFEVFATVKQIIEQFFRDYDPKSVRFMSDKDEKNRSKLYHKLFTKFLPPGYKLKKDETSSNMWDKFEVVKE